ncbi:hypothetical protein COEREDRAFT_87999 [Coemansia reversa NRRL 1564]|uniref:Uncharacterized protein n=1 Tax=Coemansia reversa (strain ATCC 12441 / NRRL 1564) TaxID=763665 RepID=A0A2G5B8Q6_COERN|nr:hypothetical protein COEREDRAFT_87999 [Coemansia reversa NRRL 1564]|eukprot:PIA15384.1 hypothetical protein COEREDRAFT_87999 [Coemansia reversa NRRL 1564]
MESSKEVISILIAVVRRARIYEFDDRPDYNKLYQKYYEGPSKNFLEKLDKKLQKNLTDEKVDELYSLAEDVKINSGKYSIDSILKSKLIRRIFKFDQEDRDELENLLHGDTEITGEYVCNIQDSANKSKPEEKVEGSIVFKYSATAAEIKKLVAKEINTSFPENIFSTGNLVVETIGEEKKSPSPKEKACTETDLRNGKVNLVLNFATNQQEGDCIIVDCDRQ